MCAVLPKEVYKIWACPQLNRMRLVLFAVVRASVAPIPVLILHKIRAATAVKAAVAPLLFWLSVAVMGIGWTWRHHRKQRRVAYHVVLVLGLLLPGLSIGAWKLAESELDVDVKTAARMWAIWYAPAIVYYWVLE